MRRLHPDITPGQSVEVDPDLAVAFIQAAADVTDAERRKRASLTRLYDLAGTAQYLTCNGIRVARRQPRGDGVSIVRTCTDPDLLTQEPPA
jgi:hypothetical protein